MKGGWTERRALCVPGLVQLVHSVPTWGIFASSGPHSMVPSFNAFLLGTSGGVHVVVPDTDPDVSSRASSSAVLKLREVDA